MGADGGSGIIEIYYTGGVDLTSTQNVYEGGTIENISANIYMGL